MTANGGNRIYINLLPKDITNKRKAEQRLVYALLAAAGIGALLFAVFAVNMLRISSRENAIKQLEEENTNYSVAINEIKSFQDKQNQVEQRQKLIDSVSNVNFSWSRFLNDVSLIIPNDVWLVKVTGDTNVISFEGQVQSSTSDTTDLGHKLVAKWLVHLEQIKSLTDVWLTTSERKDKKSETINFTTTAKIKQPETKVNTPVVPAPPPSGQTGGAAR